MPATVENQKIWAEQIQRQEQLTGLLHEITLRVCINHFDKIPFLLEPLQYG